MSEPLYKWLGADRCSYHGGSGHWVPGKWRSVRGPLILAEHGIHACRRKDLVEWIAPQLWLFEADGELVTRHSKVVVRRGRITEQLVGWDETTARLFLADCAERALPRYERKHPGDDRPAKMISAARAYARGEIPLAAMIAARCAHSSAAGLAVQIAMCATALCAVTAAGTNYAGIVSATDAASADRRWQATRLLAYATRKLR